MMPPKRGSDGSYSSFSSSSSRESSTRKYVDPWDLENALYVRGKRISFASDPSTYSAATAALDCPPASSAASPSCGDSGYCYCGYDSPAASYMDSSLLTAADPLPSMKYLNFCPYCDAQQREVPKALSALSYAATVGDINMDSCEECSACSSVAPPPPLLLFSGAGGRALSAAGLQLGPRGGDCRDCERTPSFSLTPRRFSAPAQPRPQKQQQLAYVYESPRARAKHSLPAWGAAHDRLTANANPRPSSMAPARWGDRSSKRLSLAAPPELSTHCDCGCLQAAEPSGPHAPLLAPPRHPCRWGMARSGHVAIDYTNAWMSLARRIRPSRS